MKSRIFPDRLLCLESGNIPGLLFIAFFLLSVPLTSTAQVILDRAFSERITNYDLNVELDTEKKTVSGDMILNWKNISQDTVRDLQFHMYLNAFKNSKSVFSNEGGMFKK